MIEAMRKRKRKNKKRRSTKRHRNSGKGNIIEGKVEINEDERREEGGNRSETRIRNNRKRRIRTEEY